MARAVAPAADVRSPRGLRSLPLQFPGGRGARISGIALAAWDPTTGADGAATVVVRDAATNELFWGRCDATACAALQPLTSSGRTVTSTSTVAVTTDHPTDGSPSNYSGYLPETDLWGVYKGESFD